MPKKILKKVRILDACHECEPIEIWTGPRQVPDPGWRFVDAEGETHKWHGDELPTLEQRLVNRYWCHDCDDYHEEHEWFVPATDELVEPGYLTLPSERNFIAGKSEISGTFLRLSGDVSPGDVIEKAEVEWPGGLDPEKSVGGSLRIDSISIDDTGEWTGVAPGWGME